jgi:transcription elongation factor Elf1
MGRCNHYELVIANIAGIWVSKCSICGQTFDATLEVFNGSGELMAIRIDNRDQQYDAQTKGTEYERR